MSLFHFHLHPSPVWSLGDWTPGFLPWVDTALQQRAQQEAELLRRAVMDSKGAEKRAWRLLGLETE